jgi:uncharacterized membrane protein
MPTRLLFPVFLALLIITSCRTPELQNARIISYQCVGNEPFWSVTVEPAGISFQMIDESPATYPYSSPKSKGDGMLYESGYQQSQIAVLLIPEPCSDGMSEARYPYKARIEKDGKVYEGCAFIKGQNPAREQ